MINKKTGFWIRFAARFMDLASVSSISIISAYFMMSTNEGLHFKEGYLYYVWSLEFVSLLFVWFILLPILTNGYTPFMWVFRIKIFFELTNKWKSIFKRELFFSIYWIFITILVAAVINDTLIHKYAKTNQNSIQYTNWEKIRIGIVSAVGTVSIVIQFIYSMSIFVRGDKKGIHDTQSHTWTIWVNKFVEKEDVKPKQTPIKPRPIYNNPIEWV